jgi:hypothetical protein
VPHSTDCHSAAFQGYQYGMRFSGVIVSGTKRRVVYLPLEKKVNARLTRRESGTVNSAYISLSASPINIHLYLSSTTCCPAFSLLLVYVYASPFLGTRTDQQSFPSLQIRTYSKATIVGRLGAVPIQRETANGKVYFTCVDLVANFLALRLSSADTNHPSYPIGVSKPPKRDASGGE